mgnify:FL=1|jgi:N4-gp56 family major capsid protein|tara:strand:- start:6934 stop:7770 length:837 start_codon:yes stop_codon:yes gene_type:complete
MAGSTTATLNDLLPEIVAEAMFVAQERSIMRGIVKNYNIGPAQGKTITVPIYPAQTAAAVTEGDSVSDTVVSTNGVTLTVGTVGIRTLVSDLALNSAASNVTADLGKLFGEAIATKVDTDLCALLGSFANVTGGAAITATAALVAQAAALLRGRKVPTSDTAIVLHPYIAYDLKSSITNAWQNPLGDYANEAMREGYLGMLFGIPVFENANIVDTAGDSSGAIFHREALGLAMMGEMSIETQRDASRIGTDIVASMQYGVGEIFDAYGQTLSFDSSIV